MTAPSDPPPSDPLSPALHAALTRYAAMLRGVARRFRLSEADLDEMLQEVRIRLWRAQQSEQIASVGASYMYRTAVTAALTLIRRWRARPAETQATPDAAERGDASLERDLAASELAEEVARALTTLPASRQPVVRMYLAGYTREEIADLLGWSEAKTRNLLYRGLADLRARLTERGIGPEARV